MSSQAQVQVANKGAEPLLGWECEATVCFQEQKEARGRSPPHAFLAPTGLLEVRVHLALALGTIHTQKQMGCAHMEHVGLPQGQVLVHCWPQLYMVMLSCS